MSDGAATVEIAGAKNAALPLIFAALAVPGFHKFNNFPFALGDVAVTLNWLAKAGLRSGDANGTVSLDSKHVSTGSLLSLPFVDIRYSLLLLGICLGQVGVGSVPVAGGCRFAAIRPFDIHLDLFGQLGADVTFANERITARLGKATSYARLRFPSVGATLNFIMFAACRRGTFELHGSALEPEIVSVLEFLKTNAIDYQLDKTRRILRIQSDAARSQQIVHEVIPDRVEAITWLVFSCLFQKPLRLICANRLDVVVPPDLLHAFGTDDSPTAPALLCRGYVDLLVSRHIFLGPFPRLGTDYGPLLLLLGSISNHGITVHDPVTPNRYTFVEVLRTHGIRARTESGSATLLPVQGMLDEFSAASTDLRGAVALLLFGLRFARTMKFYSLGQVQRGWHDSQAKLARLGIAFIQKGDHVLVNGP